MTYGVGVSSNITRASIRAIFSAMNRLGLGVKFPITWTKTSDYAPTKYYDMNGDEIVLNTGKTYIAVAQAGTKPSFE